MNVEEANVRIVLACEAILLAAAETGDPRDRGVKLGYLLADLILAVKAEMPCYEGDMERDTDGNRCPSCEAREHNKYPPPLDNGSHLYEDGSDLPSLRVALRRQIT